MSGGKGREGFVSSAELCGAELSRAGRTGLTVTGGVGRELQGPHMLPVSHIWNSCTTIVPDPFFIPSGARQRLLDAPPILTAAPD